MRAQKGKGAGKGKEKGPKGGVVLVPRAGAEAAAARRDVTPESRIEPAPSGAARPRPSWTPKEALDSEGLRKTLSGEAEPPWKVPKKIELRSAEAVAAAAGA